MTSAMEGQPPFNEQEEWQDTFPLPPLTPKVKDYPGVPNMGGTIPHEGAVPWPSKTIWVPLKDN